MTETTTYTICRGDPALATRGLSLEDAADECLSYDGHDWEWRENPEYAVGHEKFWEIWRSPYSRNSTLGGRGMVATRFAGYDRTAILLEVVTAEWSDNFDVMTEAQFDALLAEIAAEAAEDEGAVQHSAVSPPVGARVEGGDTPEDYDTGRVIAIEGDQVTVAWDSGTRTTQHFSLLRAAGAEAE